MNKFLKLIFYFSLILLIIISLYPGSLAGYLIYKDLSQQPNLIKNPFGTSINHFIYYFYTSLLGFVVYSKEIFFKVLIYYLLFLSVLLEIFHFVVPNRSFELYDLIANILGVLVAYYTIKIYLFLKRL